MDQIPPEQALIGWKPIAQMFGVTMQLHSSQPPLKKSKKSFEQPKKHAPKTKMQAFVRRQKLIKGLMEGRKIKDVAQTLGLSEKTATNQASLMLMAILIIPDTDSDLMPDACSEGWRTPWSERSDAGVLGYLTD
jgi:hypothetical protein